MNSTLVLLARLRARAAWRKIKRAVGTPKGALLGLFTLAILGLMIVPNLLVRRNAGPIANNVPFLNPPILFIFWLAITLSGRNAMATAFSLPEVEFLFSGPFSRRQLLVYKLILNSLGPLGTALLMPLFLMSFAIWWPALFAGVWLTFVFIQMTSMLFTLLIDWLGARFVRWRSIALVAASIVLAASLLQTGALEGGRTPLERLDAFQSAWAARVVLAPFECFSRLARATTVAELALWGGPALAINALVVLLILRMDANFLEASLAASQRRYQWIERARRSGGMPAIGTRSKPRFGLPRFPWLAGVGPIAWRQSLELIRTSARLIVVLPAMLAFGAPAAFAGEEVAGYSVIGMTVFVGFMISMMIPMGLRIDLEHVEMLKSLPIRAGAIVWGSIAAAVLYPTLIQLLAVVLLSAFIGRWTPMATAAVCFAVPLNLLLVSADAIMVLLFPSTRRFIPGDLLAGVRLMVTYMVKVLLIMLAAAIAGLYALVVYLLMGEAEIAMATAAWITLIIEGCVTVWCASLLFERFDPSAESSEER
jgi:hypothetical protein